MGNGKNSQATWSKQMELTLFLLVWAVSRAQLTTPCPLQEKSQVWPQYFCGSHQSNLFLPLKTKPHYFDFHGLKNFQMKPIEHFYLPIYVTIFDLLKN